jgi:hypothetical protein
MGGSIAYAQNTVIAQRHRSARTGQHIPTIAFCTQDQTELFPTTLWETLEFGQGISGDGVQRHSHLQWRLG